jgi:sugar O-acyltransferase (sialic acid O-acetyltransferase NeuD family)
LKSNSKTALIGAGGHCRSVIELLSDCDFDVIGVYDDSFDQNSEEFISGSKLMGSVLDANGMDTNVVLAVGDNQKRALLFEKFRDQIIEPTLIHSSVIHSSKMAKGVSNLIFARVTINAEVKLGDNNILNTACIIEHECQIGSHNHISVGSTLCGRVTVGNRCFIGAGCTIIDGVSIGDDVVIGAGSTVLSDVPEAGTYVGNPIRRIK